MISFFSSAKEAQETQLALQYSSDVEILSKAESYSKL